MSSQSTLCRLESRIDRLVAIDIYERLLERFIASYAEAQDELALDLDATDDPAQGQ
ncbi:MAG: transposase [Candidatus Thiodiazotropha sp. (ex Lucinoma kastoroae)]|nr:transposase [Candidatus Thiodiazotropha sp. (ex Lucinoma kastoroae)]